MNRINWFIHIFLNQEVVGKTDRTGDKTLNLQHFFAMSFGLSVENIYYIAIAVLACILGAEIAGICMLIGKMRRARNGEADAPNDEYDNNTGANYALAALSFGAVSATAELVLLVLAIAALVGAFVLCVLLVAFYAKGYLLISAKAAKEAEQAEAKARAEREAEQEAIQASATEELYDVEEPAEQYDDYADDEAALEAVSNLIATEDAVMSEEYEEEEEETAEPEAEPEEAVETAVVAQESTVPAVQTVERTIITEGAPAYGGQAPIVEKHIIETTKEIIKETNTTTVTEGGKSEQFSPATEEMMKAITEFMKLETQLRMEREVPVERPAAEDGASTPAFADAEDEEIEADEVDTEDELDAEDEAQREADAEENDDEYESDLFGNERIVGFDEETGCYIIARYRKSCEAKLMQSRPQTKKYYSAIRNALMGYEGTKERMSWTIDTYTNEHTPIAKINVRPRTLDLYLALEPSTLEDSVYRGKDVSAKKKYAETPFLYKVNSPRKLTLALELVQRACEEQGLSPIDIEEINYEEQYPFTDTETLITRALIREYLREEKPAATFELDPDHVPQLIVEDETVIPANANFTWEFDNDQPEHEEVVEEPVVEEPVVEEEPIVEEPVVEEPTVEEAPAAPVSGTTTTTTTHETIRTTERHYTERYFAGAKEAEVKEETRTIEVLPEPVAEPIEAVAEEIAPEVVAEEPTFEEQPQEEAPVEEAVEETAEEVVEEIEEEVEEEIIDDEIVEEPEEATTDEQVAQMQSAVAALFGDDVFDEDEPIEEPTPEVVEESASEEVIEEETVEEETVEEPKEEPVEETVEETVEEEPVEEPAPEAEAAVEVVEDVIEEVYEEEAEEEVEEEVIYEEAYEEEPEEEIEEEVIYEEVYEEEPEEEIEEEVIYEEVYEEEPEETEEEYYEEIVYEEEPEEETEEEYYEEVVYEEAPEEDEEYYEEVYEEVYEDVEGEEYEEVYEEEVEEEEVEEPAPTPAPQPASDVVLLDVCVFDDYFDNGAIVNLETLKQVGLAPESATRLKVYASGALKGRFTVEANHFTLDAIKAIGDADGDSIMIR